MTQTRPVNRAIIQLSPQLLAKMMVECLDIPEDTEVEAVKYLWDSGILRVKVNSKEGYIRVLEGCEIPTVTPEVLIP